MAEIGLVRFARVALEVAEAVLPDYPTKFSPSTPSPSRNFWPFSALYTLRGVDPLRKAEVRLAEHGELRDALGLYARHPSTHHALPRFMRRLDESRPWLPP